MNSASQLRQEFDLCSQCRIYTNPSAITEADLRILHTLLIVVSTRLPTIFDKSVDIFLTPGPSFQSMAGEHSWTKLVHYVANLQVDWFIPWFFEVSFGY